MDAYTNKLFYRVKEVDVEEIFNDYRVSNF